MNKRVFLLLAAALFAGCGGGGGGTSTTPSAPNPQNANIHNVSVQRAVATQSLFTAQTALQLGGSGSSIVPLSTMKRVMSVGRNVLSTARGRAGTQSASRTVRDVAYSACNNGQESATVTVSPTEEQLYQRNFYDTACTELHEDMYLDMVAVSATEVRATGNVTQYTTSGAQFAYNVVTLDFVQGTTTQISMTITDALTSTSPQIAKVGIACSGTTSLACGVGGVTHSQTANADAGATLSMTVSQTSSPSGGYTLPLSLTVSGYTGAYNALDVVAAQQFPNWNITGGTLVDTASATGQLAINAQGALTSFTLTLTDTADDATVTMTNTGTEIDGTVKQTSTGTSIATFTVDENGNGTITYSNGTTAQISGWTVLG